MNSLTIFSINEQNSIEAELEVLFACQGKTLHKEIRPIWLNELVNSGIPHKAIIQGLRFLKSEEIQTLKLNTVLSAARRFIEFEQVSDCEDCNSGYIVMKDSEGRNYSLACRCSAGQMKKNQGLVQWLGDSTQFSNGRTLTKF